MHTWSSLEFAVQSKWRRAESKREMMFRLYLFVIESVLTFSITVWSGSASIHNKNMLEGIVKTPSKITGSKLPSIESIYTTRTLCKATTIISDCTYPANHLFESLPSGKRFRSIKTRTTRFSNSFYPKAVQTKPPNTKSKEQERKKVEKKEREKKGKKSGGGGGGIKQNH